MNTVDGELDLEHVCRGFVEDAKGVPDIIIPEGITKMAPDAFYIRKELVSAKLPSTLLWIRSNAFARTSLKEIHIPESVREVHSHAFANCKYLTRLVLDDIATTLVIHYDAFRNPRLETLVLEGVSYPIVMIDFEVMVVIIDGVVKPVCAMIPGALTTDGTIRNFQKWLDRFMETPVENLLDDSRLQDRTGEPPEISCKRLIELRLGGKL